jgi:hypothetical protein
MNDKAKRSRVEKTEDQLEQQVCVTECNIWTYVCKLLDATST